jgi:diguanylate cyclase (GGDEF)-like protein/PAS domain S-box-containing protein
MRLRAIIETALEAVVQMDEEGIITGWSKQAEKIFGWPREEAIGRSLHETIIPHQYREAHVQGLKHFLLSGEGPILNSRIEIIGLRRNGHEFPIELSITTIKVDNTYEFSAFIHDITERKETEEKLEDSVNDLRIAATAFETQAAMMITDTTPKILRVNKAFEEITGYTAEEAIGQNPNMLSAPEIRQSKAFYEEMWTDLLSTGKWSGEVLDKRKDGVIYPKQLMITVVNAPDGTITHYVGSFFDITKRRKAEEDINRLAFYDPLTRLPNRRLLQDRLQQAMAVGKRSGWHGAVLFLDLDHFKNVNDTQGHAVGDLLLVEVARRLQSCMREGDSIARLGGDEFVVVLEELSHQSDEAATQAELVAEKIRDELSKP